MSNPRAPASRPKRGNQHSHLTVRPRTVKEVIIKAKRGVGNWV